MQGLFLLLVGEKGVQCLSCVTAPVNKPVIHVSFTYVSVNY